MGLKGIKSGSFEINLIQMGLFKADLDLSQELNTIFKFLVKHSLGQTNSWYNPFVFM